MDAWDRARECGDQSHQVDRKKVELCLFVRFRVGRKRQQQARDQDGQGHIQQYHGECGRRRQLEYEIVRQRNDFKTGVDEQVGDLYQSDHQGDRHDDQLLGRDDFGPASGCRQQGFERPPFFLSGNDVHCDHRSARQGEHEQENRQKPSQQESRCVGRTRKTDILDPHHVLEIDGEPSAGEDLFRAQPPAVPEQFAHSASAG